MRLFPMVLEWILGCLEGILLVQVLGRSFGRLGFDLRRVGVLKRGAGDRFVGSNAHLTAHH